MMRMFKIGSKLATRRTHSFITSPPLIQHARALTAQAKKLADKPRALPLKVPDKQFFEELKAEEHKQTNHKKRKRFAYEDNYTAALALPYSKKQLDKKQNDEHALLAMSKQFVVEHANRRVDLFFYTLVAYYKTGIFPTRGHTSLQHGKGRNTDEEKNITQACHSSLTPSLIDEAIFQRGAEHKGLLDGTHLMDSLNSTVELPPFVNHFDDELENTFLCREKSLTILCDVSLGKMNPIQGLSEFLKMMRDVFNELKQQAEQKGQTAPSRYSFHAHRHISPELVHLVKKGTLRSTFSKETHTASDDYIQLLLRMTPEEKVLCAKDTATKEKLYLVKIMAMQKEILRAKSLPRLIEPALTTHRHPGA